MQSPNWSSNTRLLIVVVSLAGALALFFFALPLVETLIISGLLAYLLDPLVRFVMRKLKFGRSLSAALIYALLIILVISIPATIGTLVFSQISRLGENFQQVLDGIQSWLSQPFVLFGIDLSPRNLVQQFGRSAGSALGNLTGDTLAILSGISTNFLWILLVLVSLYYFLRDGPEIKPWLVSLASPAYKTDAQRLLDEVDRVWGLFMRVQVIIFIILLILFLLGASIVVWLYQLGLIPFSTIGLVVMLVLVYALVQQVDNLWLRPQMLGSQLRMHPGVVFVTFIGALAIGGVLLAIVAVPMVASIKIVGGYVRQKLLGLPPWPEVQEE